MERIDCRLMVFAKAPIPGRVKTRLIPVMGEEPASELYEKMVSHCLAEGIKAGVGPVDLWCAPSSDHPFFIHCEEKFQVKLHDQPEGDLGQRMGYAFSETLKISTYALLMGGDCPSLTPADIRAAKAELEKDHDAVIIPAEDGGYVLLGLRRYAEELFSGISWGTESVFKQTRMRLRGLGWQWHELPERWDVDRPEDLRRIISMPV
ncbi:MAG: glycosyltransferase [Deltaproteobacteria bacterium]|nr:glycosyltransferase [Deltaproteobacteria bacterium]MBM4322511.1 glycosyltransferase [Deltaproteobacteria bacterium]